MFFIVDDYVSKNVRVLYNMNTLQSASLWYHGVAVVSVHFGWSTACL